MCALFGWLDYKGRIPYKVLKRLTQELANSCEERGTDASGISYVKNDKITIYKRPKPAHKIRFTFPEGTTAIMGHTRMTTQGNEKFNYNNHPFYGTAGDTSFSFSHNGIINDLALRRNKLIPDTHIETDSYAACQLIESQGKLNFDSLKYMAETVEGNFTFTILDEHNNLYIIKGSNPIYLLHFRSLGLFIYASTESIMNNALKRVGLHKISTNKIAVSEGDILRIDNNGEITHSEFEPKPYFSKYASLYNYDDAYYGAYEELLLTYCGFCGVDSSDVELLLSFYSCDEVEQMLADTKLLHEALRDIRFMCGEEIYEDCYSGVF